ncbi:MAG: Rieske 2Fe-2S domain-containing protein [Coriobacteriia bacterium]|nr:Rieske 2Fe-2S domain-containing protein [Coriobacteriia bacterium]
MRRVFFEGTTVDDLKAYMGPFAERLGYKFNTEIEFVDEVLESELVVLERDGDVYCPCRVRVGDPKEDLKIVCPCIPFYLDEFAALRKCWCGLFIREDVEDGADLIGVIEQPEPGTQVDVPVCLVEDLQPGTARHVKVGKVDLAVVRVGEEVFALSNVCRHAFAPLDEGFVDGYALVCPWHGWRYDVRDGTTDHPNADVRTFPAMIRNGEVLVTVPLGRAR